MGLKIRIFQKIFGSFGPTAEFGKIGSKAAASPIKTKDLALMQTLAQYEQGLAAIISDQGTSQLPYLEDLNSLFLLITSQLAYIMQSGIPEWDAETEYYKDVSMVLFNKEILIDAYGTPGTPNLNFNPSTNPTKWVPLTLTNLILITPEISDPVITGNLQGVTANFSGLLQGVTANFSGTVSGNSATFSGQVGIKTPAHATYKLHILGSSTGQTASPSGDDLVLEPNSNGGISILNGLSSNGSIIFGNPNNTRAAMIQYSNNTAKLGFYTETAGNVTTLALEIDNEQNLEIPKGNLEIPEGNIILTNGGIQYSSGPIIKQKMVSSVIWDMDTTSSISILHGLDFTKFLSVEATIQNDAGTEFAILTMDNGGQITWGSTHITLQRTFGGYFDNTDYNSGVVIRARVLITYRV